MSGLGSVVDRYLTAYNDRDFERWTELLTPDVSVVADAGTFHGRDAARAFAAATVAAFPGVRAELERIAGETADSIAVEYRLVNPDESAHHWLLAGTVCDIYNIVDGRIARVHSYYLASEDDRTPVAQIPSRAEAALIANESRGLARLAAMVARHAAHDDLFNAVTEEIARLVPGETALLRYDDAVVTVIAASGDGRWPFAVGERRAVDASLSAIRDDREPSRVGAGTAQDDGLFLAEARELGHHSVLGVPIVVGGRTWGLTVSAASSRLPLPEGTETRIASFLELIATAIALTRTRDELATLFAEQAALRRVATLVAKGGRPAQIFAVTVAEIRSLLEVDSSALWRYDADETTTLVAIDSDQPLALRVGTRLPIEGDSAMAAVYRTRDVARRTGIDRGHGGVAAAARASGLRSAVGAPIVVDGRLWGAVVASSRQPEMPDDTIPRLVGFSELVATAIANADSRTQLVRSRARLVATADEARRRVARDLHDGAQQRLVHTIVTLKLAQRADDDTSAGAPSRAALLGEALAHAEGANAELRDLAHGILPAALTDHGLRAAVKDLVARSDVPVSASVTAARLPPAVEASAYFVIAESLTNIVKHANATRASVQAWIDETTFYLEIRDDGVGGAQLDGAGFVGLQDRITALGGHLRVDSPPGRGTSLRVELAL